MSRVSSVEAHVHGTLDTYVLTEVSDATAISSIAPWNEKSAGAMNTKNGQGIHETTHALRPSLPPVASPDVLVPPPPAMFDSSSLSMSPPLDSISTSPPLASPAEPLVALPPDRSVSPPPLPPVASPVVVVPAVPAASVNLSTQRNMRQ